MLLLLEYQRHQAKLRQRSDYRPWGGRREHGVMGSMLDALERRGLVETTDEWRPYARRMGRLTEKGLAHARHLHGKSQAMGGAL